MATVEYEQLKMDLRDCASACNACFTACLEEDDVKMMARCIKLDRECADMCAFLLSAIEQKSDFVAELASVCAKMCEMCGQECNKHEAEHCKICAQACFKCAEACRNIAYVS